MKATTIPITRRQVEVLLSFIEEKADRSSRSCHVKDRSLRAIQEELWRAYADTHPEEGPFQ